MPAPPAPITNASKVSIGKDSVNFIVFCVSQKIKWVGKTKPFIPLFKRNQKG